MANIKPKAKRRARASAELNAPDLNELVKKEIHQLIGSREGAMEHLCIHENDCSIKICRVDRLCCMNPPQPVAF